MLIYMHIYIYICNIYIYSVYVGMYKCIGMGVALVNGNVFFNIHFFISISQDVYGTSIEMLVISLIGFPGYIVSIIYMDKLGELMIVL